MGTLADVIASQGVLGNHQRRTRPSLSICRPSATTPPGGPAPSSVHAAELAQVTWRASHCGSCKPWTVNPGKPWAPGAVRAQNALRGGHVPPRRAPSHGADIERCRRALARFAA